MTGLAPQAGETARKIAEMLYQNMLGLGVGPAFPVSIAEMIEPFVRSAQDEARREAEKERDEWKARVEAVNGSMLAHFQRDHIEGDGPEIDRWKRKVAALEEQLRQAKTT